MQVRPGFHFCVATPGRMNDMLTKKRFNLDLCKYLCLDEADRLIGEANFEEEVRWRSRFRPRSSSLAVISSRVPTYF